LSRFKNCDHTAVSESRCTLAAVTASSKAASDDADSDADDNDDDDDDDASDDDDDDEDNDEDNDDDDEDDTEDGKNSTGWRCKVARIIADKRRCIALCTSPGSVNW
jgi:hypothetical protein